MSAFHGRQETIDQLDKIGLDEIVLSAVTVGDKKKIDSEFGKDNWINKRFILSVLSNFFDQKNSESIFFPILMELIQGMGNKEEFLTPYCLHITNAIVYLRRYHYLYNMRGCSPLRALMALDATPTK